MKKYILLLLVTLSLTKAKAQCPYVSGAMINAYSDATNGEGKNEFIAITAGGSALSVTGFVLGYGNSVTASDITINSATAGIWTSLPASPAITNSLGTIIDASGLASIPAGATVVLLPNNYSVSYDFKAFGSTVYVLCFDATKTTGTPSGWKTNLSSDNLKNTGGAGQFFKLSAGPSCTGDTVMYIPSSLSPLPGAGVLWSATGAVTYVNSGATGAVLPLKLIGFNAKRNINNGVELNWTTAGKDIAKIYEVERSDDGINFSKLYPSVFGINKYENTTYTFYDNINNSGLYRLAIKEDAETFYSNTIEVKNTDKEVASNILIYPSPFKSRIKIEIKTPNFNNTVSIFDYVGKLIMQNELKSGINDLDLNSLPRGQYILKLNDSIKGLQQLKITKEE